VSPLTLPMFMIYIKAIRLAQGLMQIVCSFV